MIRLLLAFPVAAGLTLGAVAAPSAPVSADGVLQRLLQAEGRLVYQGVLDTNGESRLKVTAGADRQQRQEWLSPSDMAGDLVIDNGSMRWHYSPQDANADVGPSEQMPMSPAARFALIRQNYRLSLQPGRTIAGEATRLLVLTPRAPRQVEHRLFVADKGLALRTERWRDGRQQDYAAFTAISWQPSLSSDVFAPSLPTGAKVKPTIHVLASGQNLTAVASRLDFRPQLPSRLPSGFQVASVRVFTTGEGKAPIAHVQLTDGMSSLSLFARKASAWRLPPESRPVALPGGVQGARLDHGPATMVIWQVGGTRYSLVGSIAPEALIDTAAASVTGPGHRADAATAKPSR
jgi:outer membrane lipoprotein-sorting protein